MLRQFSLLLEKFEEDLLAPTEAGEDYCVHYKCLWYAAADLLNSLSAFSKNFLSSIREDRLHKPALRDAAHHVEIDLSRTLDIFFRLVRLQSDKRKNATAIKHVWNWVNAVRSKYRLLSQLDGEFHLGRFNLQKYEGADYLANFWAYEESKELVSSINPEDFRAEAANEISKMQKLIESKITARPHACLSDIWNDQVLWRYETRQSPREARAEPPTDATSPPNSDDA